jgi:hypothetical protein
MSSVPFSQNGTRPPRPWRPFTLRATTLFLFLFFTIGLIAVVEALSNISTRNKALFFADPQQGFSIGEIFCYRYLPQMIVVLYGIGWAAVDLDVKRLEPYFQLSKPGGASASDSIFLHYPSDFLALVPITAAKRKFVFPFPLGVARMLTTGLQALERFCCGDGPCSDLLGYHTFAELPVDNPAGSARHSHDIYTGPETRRLR